MMKGSQEFEDETIASIVNLSTSKAEGSEKTDQIKANNAQIKA